MSGGLPNTTPAAGAFRRVCMGIGRACSASLSRDQPPGTSGVELRRVDNRLVAIELEAPA